MTSVALGLVLVLPYPATAQSIDSSLIGARVRIQHQQEDFLGALNRLTTIGTLIAFRSDTLYLAHEAGTSTEPIPLAALRNLEVSRGQRSKWATGLGIGLLAGAAAGAALGRAEFGEGFDLSSRDAALLGAVPFGVVGALIGAHIGSSSKAEAWQNVLRRRSRAAVGTSP